MLSSGGGKPGGSFPTALSMLATFTSFQTAWYIIYIALSPFPILCLPDAWALVDLKNINGQSKFTFNGACIVTPPGAANAWGASGAILWQCTGLNFIS